MSALPHIAINGRFLTQPLTGVQRFALETVTAINDLLDDPAFRDMKGRIEILAPQEARDFPLGNIPLRRCGRRSGYVWEQIEYPREARGQLLLSLCILGPLVARRQLVVVHDATVKALPQTFNRSFRAAYNFILPLLLRRAQCIVAVSEFSRREVAHYYGVDPARMTVCYEGGEHILSVPADRSVLEKHALVGKPYFLSVGGSSPNKRFPDILAALQKTGITDAPLVLTGGRNSKLHHHVADASSAQVVVTGQVSDAQLRALYEGALALVYPSSYEGFGIPPLEAMNCGCPALISDQAALQEVCGDAALQSPIGDVAALAANMQTVHADPALREKMRAAGHARAKQFSWPKTGRFLLETAIAFEAGRAGVS